VTRSEFHKFFSELTKKYPENTPDVLIDIFMDYFAFPKQFMHPEEEEVKKHVQSMLQQNPNNLIPAVKYVREKLYCGLKEAKDFVETGTFPDRTNELQKILEQNLESIVQKIKEDYNV